MQDIHPTLTAAGTSLPHRHHHLHHQNSSPSSPALKCPRCDSSNTKFCYYNNYNLSQPRHFCKSCRRYWTYGGVLRNVPVGGASRKTTKRSKPKPKPKHSLSSSSSADSTTAGRNGAVLEVPPEIGGFMSLMTDPAPDSDPLGFLQTEGLGEGILDPTVKIDDLLENRGSSGGVVALDWELGTDPNIPGLFDQDYWTQSTTSFQQWSENISNNNSYNHDYLSLFLP